MGHRFWVPLHYVPHGRAIKLIWWWLCSSFPRPPIPQLHLPSESLSGLGVTEGRGGTPGTHPSTGTHFVEGNRRKTEGSCYPQVEGGARERGAPLGAYGPVDRCGREPLFGGEHQSAHKKIFNPPRKPSYTPSHPTDMCTFSPVKVAPSAPPTMAYPAYHPLQMPVVQNSYTNTV